MDEPRYSALTNKMVIIEKLKKNQWDELEIDFLDSHPAKFQIISQFGGSERDHSGLPGWGKLSSELSPGKLEFSTEFKREESSVDEIFR